MRSTLSLLVSFFLLSHVLAQPPRVYNYTLDNINLPAEMNKQVCISGLKFYDGKLYFASERCPVIIVFDPVSATIVKRIDLNVPQMFEMEGMTSYHNKFFLVSENVAAVYQVDPATGALSQVPTSVSLPPKSKDGDGMEGIAANEKNDKFYLLRERNDDLSASQLYTYAIQKTADGISLKQESMIEIPLENPQWRYSDITYDRENSRLLCLKSYAKGKFRQQYLESIDVDAKGNLVKETLTNIPVENFTDASSAYKTQQFSMNLEGITVDDKGTIYIISDNTSGKANCDNQAKEKTILLHLRKK